MDDKELLVNHIAQYIRDNKSPSILSTNGKELRVRCPDCGDSVKSGRHAHFYIEMAPPFKFLCHRCSFSGVLNTEILEYLDLYDKDINTAIRTLSKDMKKDLSYSVNIKKKTKFKFDERQSDDHKYKYINDRYGWDYPSEYWVDNYKVVANVPELINQNKIIYDPMMGPLLNTFDSDYVGFLSADSTHCIMRDVTGKHPKRRYWNWNMYNLVDANKFYTIKRNLDLMAPEVTLVMAEGIFDIIGVYEHFYKDEIKDNTDYIFASAAGNTYDTLIAYFSKMGLLNLNVIIYSDSDISIEHYKRMKERSDFLGGSRINIYYNDHPEEKDFGVSKDKIKLRRAKI